MPDKDDTKKDASPDIASDKQNDKLKHVAGGRTTRDDPLDAGVPMLPGSPDEPVGPEDALGIGPKRGDYTGRVGPSNYQPHQAVPIADADRDKDADGNPTGARARLEAQAPRAEDIGDEPGVKGGTHLSTEEPRPATR